MLLAVRRQQQCRRGLWSEQVRMWEQLSLVAAQVGLAELARQVSRRQQQQQGDDGQHQLLEQFSCPCLEDALVRVVTIVSDWGFRTDG
jgi:hypothetical protein